MKKQVNTKIEEKDLQLIKKACKILDIEQSHFIRIAIKKQLDSLGLLTKSESKILGIGIK